MMKGKMRREIGTTSNNRLTPSTKLSSNEPPLDNLALSNGWHKRPCPNTFPVFSKALFSRGRFMCRFEPEMRTSNPTINATQGVKYAAWRLTCAKIGMRVVPIKEPMLILR